MEKWLLSATLLTMMAMPSYCQILRTTVAQGEIEGVNENGYALYKKIPYAEAPVSDLRWKAPIPKKLGKAFTSQTVGVTVRLKFQTLTKTATTSQ